MSKFPLLPQGRARHSVRAALTLLMLALAGFGAAPRALAQANANPPERPTYQGFLADGNGVALATNAPKNYDVVFRIWDDASATAPANRFWTEQQTVTVDKGFFSVLLGEGAQVTSPATEPHGALSTLFTNATASDRFVEMTVKGIGAGGADVKILPRLRLLTAPYAFLAANAVNVTGAGTLTLNNLAPNAVDSTKIVDGTIISADLAANAVDSSKILDGSIVNADISASAAIADAKLATIATAGKVADSALSPNVALRGSANTFNGNQRVVGLVRMGSDTTSQAPNLPGLVVRRINSSSSATNQVVAKCVEGYFGALVTLERDGTAGGWVIRGSGTIGNFVVAGTGITTAGATVNVYKTYGGSIGTSQIFTQAQDIGHFRLSFGDPWQTSHMTEVVLTHWPGGVVWIGTVTSTVDQ